MPKEKPRSKLFILDTNVILHDADCLYNFDDNDIVIPISALEELDQFKRGNEQIHYNARQFLRRLDTLSNDNVDGEDDSLGSQKGTVKVVVNHHWHPDVEASFQEDNPDHRILNCAYKLAEDNPDRDVILVSKDTNMRLKARSLKISSEDYTTDKVESIEKIYSGVRTIENFSSDIIDKLYSENNGIDLELIDSIEDPKANENFVLRNGQKSGLATFSSNDKFFKRVDKPHAYNYPWA